MQIQLFGPSRESFLLALGQAEILYEPAKKRAVPNLPMAASGDLIELVGSPELAALAMVLIAWVKDRKNRRVTVTTIGGIAITDIQGYSAENAALILKDAQRIQVADITPPSITPPPS